MYLRKIFVRRKYRDLLFMHIFTDKKDLLNLYNALNGTNYTNPDDLEITTLDDVIYLSMKNDLAFIIFSTLNLYEHQSTYNPNMPLRGLLYFARMYDAYVTMHKLNMYGKSMVKIPAPQFVVFYNGQEDAPDEQTLKLSDAFMIPQDEEDVMLECKARMLNINYGHNKEVMGACKRLHDYSYFVYCVNENIAKHMNLKDAINLAIDQCIEEDVLADILIKQRSEVFHMVLTHYDKKLHEKYLKEEGYEEGKIAGRFEGRLEGEIVGTIETMQELGTDQETAMQKLVGKYGLTDDKARDYISKHWK